MVESSFAPHSDDVSFWTHIHRIPALIFRVPHIEVVVMYSHADEIFGASFFIQRDESTRVEGLGFPRGNGIFVPEFRGMPVCLYVVVVLRAALHVHVARIPIAIFDRGLRAPMRPDAKFGIGEPFWDLIFAERLAGPLKRSCFDFDARGQLALLSW